MNSRVNAVTKPSSIDVANAARSARSTLGTHQRMEHQATIYTREGCHLCERAHEMLTRFGVEVALVDIDQDDALRAQYNECVPVVWIDGKERFRGNVDERLLRRLLRSRN